MLYKSLTKIMASPNIHLHNGTRTTSGVEHRPNRKWGEKGRKWMVQYLKNRFWWGDFAINGKMGLHWQNHRPQNTRETIKTAAGEICVPWPTPVAPSSPQHDQTSLQGDFPRDTAFTSKKTHRFWACYPCTPSRETSHLKTGAENIRHCSTGRVQHRLLVTDNFPTARYPKLCLHKTAHPRLRSVSALQGCEGIFPCPNTTNPIPAHGQNAHYISHTLLAALLEIREVS